MNLKNNYLIYSYFIYFFLILAFIEWYQHIYIRSIIFFILVSISYFLVVLKIFIYPVRKYYLHILLDIFLISLFIRFSVYYNYPTVYGWDPFEFIRQIQLIISDGFLSSGMLKYTGFPLFHILIVFTKEFTGFNIKDSYFLGAIIEVFCGLFMFIICKNLFNLRVGLLSTSLLLISPNNLTWGSWIIPMALSMNIYLIIIFFIVKQKERFQKLLGPFLLIILTSIFIHPIGSVIIILTFIVFYLYPKIGPIKEKIISFNILLITTASVYLHWTLTDTGDNIDLFSNLMIRFITTIRVRMIGYYDISIQTKAPLINYTYILLTDLPFTFLLFLGLLGSLFVIDKKIKNKNYVYIELIITLLLLISITYASGLIAMTSIEPARWFSFIEILLAIFASNGIIFITDKILKKNYKILTCLPLLSIIIFSSLSSPSSNTDSTFYANELPGTTTYLYKRAALIDSELSASIFINKVYNEKIFASDDYMLLNFTSINLDELYVTRNKPLIVRTYDMVHGFWIAGSLFGFSPDSNFKNYMYNCDKLFDNNKVQIYLRN